MESRDERLNQFNRTISSTILQNKHKTGKECSRKKYEFHVFYATCSWDALGPQKEVCQKHLTAQTGTVRWKGPLPATKWRGASPGVGTNSAARQNSSTIGCTKIILPFHPQIDGCINLYSRQNYGGLIHTSVNIWRRIN